MTERKDKRINTQSISYAKIKIISRNKKKESTYYEKHNTEFSVTV